MQLLKYVLPPYSEQRQNGGAISLPPHIKKNDNKFLYNNSPDLYKSRTQHIIRIRKFKNI